VRVRPIESCASPRTPMVRLTPRISCEAVPPSILPAGAQGGTLSCRTGAALSFVSCIRLFDRALALRDPWLTAPRLWTGRFPQPSARIRWYHEAPL
jgi:hypothetical protein